MRTTYLSRTWTLDHSCQCLVHCTVCSLYTTNDFSAIPEIGQLHKELGSKSCHSGFLFFFFYFRLGPCIYRVWCRVRRLVEKVKFAISKVPPRMKTLKLIRKTCLLARGRVYLARRTCARTWLSYAYMKILEDPFSCIVQSTAAWANHGFNLGSQNMNV